MVSAIRLVVNTFLTAMGPLGDWAVLPCITRCWKHAYIVFGTGSVSPSSDTACDRPQGLNRGAVEQFVLLGAWSPVACVEDAVGGVDLFRGKVLHVTRTALVAHSSQSDEQAVVEEPENGLPRSRGDQRPLQ